MSQSEGASTFTKGLRVLECFESRQRHFTMAELARLTGFDRATTRRLCLSLVESGYLSKTDQNLRLTPRILSVAGGYLGANDIGLSVQPILDQFASQLDCEISVAVRDSDRAIYVASAKVESSRVSLGLTVGSTLPLMHTAIGRMILSSCSDEFVSGVFERLTPYKHTPHTLTEIDAIRNRIEQTRTQGFAYVENEFETGAAAIAVPVGRLSGNEAVVGVTHSVNTLQQPVMQERVLDTLRQTSIALQRLSIFA